MSETTTWKCCAECRRRFAFYAEIDKSRCYECELKRKAYREGYEAFRRGMVEALTGRARYYEAQASRTEKSAAFVLDAKTARRVCKILANGVASGTFPPKPKEGT